MGCKVRMSYNFLIITSHDSLRMSGLHIWRKVLIPAAIPLDNWPVITQPYCRPITFLHFTHPLLLIGWSTDTRSCFLCIPRIFLTLRLTEIDESLLIKENYDQRQLQVKTMVTNILRQCIISVWWNGTWPFKIPQNMTQIKIQMNPWIRRTNKIIQTLYRLKIPCKMSTTIY